MARRRVFIQQHRRVEVDQHGNQTERIVPIDHVVRIACGHHQRRHAAQNTRRKADRLAADLHFINLLRLRIAVQRDQQQIPAVRADVQQRIVGRSVLLVVGIAHVREGVDAAGIAVHRDGIACLQHVPHDLEASNRPIAHCEEQIVPVLQHVVDLRVHDLRLQFHDSELARRIVHQLQTANIVPGNHGDVVRSDETAPDLGVASTFPLRHTLHLLQESNLRGRDLHVHAVVHAGVQRFLEGGEVGHLDDLEVAVSGDRDEIGAIGRGENGERIDEIVIQGGKRVESVVHVVRDELDRRQNFLDVALDAQRDGAEPTGRSMPRSGNESIHGVRDRDHFGHAGDRGKDRSGLQGLQFVLDDVVDGQADARI